MERCLVKCNDVDCDVSEWKNITKCTKSCGGGTQVLQRIVDVYPLYDGKKCPIGFNEYSKTTNCNTHPCSGILIVSDVSSPSLGPARLPVQRQFC